MICPHAAKQVNKMTVMRSIVRGRFWGRRDSTTASPRGDMFGLVYSADEEVPRTGYYNQLRRYRDWVRGSREVGAQDRIYVYTFEDEFCIPKMKVLGVMIFSHVERDTCSSSFGPTCDIAVKYSDYWRHGLIFMSTAIRTNVSIPLACCTSRASHSL